MSPPFRRPQAAEKGPAARRRPKAAREAYSLYVERAAEGANEADGPLSSPWRPEDAAGERARVLPVVEDDLAADDDPVDAVRPLDAPRTAARPVVRHLVLLHPEAREVEDHQVRDQALAHQAAIVEPHDPRRLEGEPADGVLESKELPLPPPLGKDVGGLARGAEVRVEVRARVRLRG